MKMISYFTKIERKSNIFPLPQPGNEIIFF